MEQKIKYVLEVDRDLLYQFEDAVMAKGEKMEDNLIKHMQEVADSLVPNEETLEAFREMEEFEKNPSAYKAYKSVEEMMEDILK